jgi:hypothetical protein
MGLSIYVSETDYRFKAGSYSGFNAFREQLKQICKGEAFEELLEHSDCDGELDYDECVNLLTDFDKYACKVKKLRNTEYNRYFSEVYDEFHEVIREIVEAKGDKKIVFM